MKRFDGNLLAIRSLLILVCVSSVSLAGNISDFETSVRTRIAAHDGKVAVAIRHLQTAQDVRILADEPMPTASLIKVAVMIEAYRRADQGILDLNRMLILNEEDKVPGSGILTSHFSAGMSLSLRDAVRLMMVYSDNTATNLVIDQLGLPSTSRAMEELGFPNTKLHAKVFRASTSIFPERSRQFGLGSTTAGEMLSLLEHLWQGRLAGEASTKAMLDHMRACDDSNRLTRLLPTGTVVARKTGSVSAVRTDAGIIESPSGPIAIVILTSENKDQRWAKDNSAEVLTGELARMAYDFFNPEQGTPAGNEPVVLKSGANGWLVEALQRTLNDRLDPSPGLSVDGDFGPQTEKAVRLFQESCHLPQTGVVDAECWARLGPLMTDEEVITDPKLIETSLPAKMPADELTGLPFVTCRGWAIGNPDSREILAGDEVDTLRPNASTTKLMTAYLVLKYAETHPEFLEELVTVSDVADQTPGSTASLRAGEQLTVHEILYGLLLPSGNDAAVVLAEHLGTKFLAERGNPESIFPFDMFVTEMNAAAAQLGMTHTTFKNPHGLSEEGHGSSPRDLFLLASELISQQSILPFVSCRIHVGTIHSLSGYKRFQRWENTNRLLKIEGYHGLKTGTTGDAGACLVSLAERDGRKLVLVVLGATSTESRYTDSRNLFRWAWQNTSK